MAERISDTVYGLINDYTGEWHTFNVVTTWLDGTPMSVGKCDGVIFRQAPTGEFMKLNYTGHVNAKWFGAVGDGVTDDSVAVQSAINAFRGYGASILLPPGTYILGDIQLPSSISIVCQQTAKFYGLSQLEVKIIPSPSAEYIFYFEDNCHNSELLGIYTEATGNTTLTAAVRFTGNACNLEKCLFNANPKYGVISSAGNSFIRHCGIFGWYGPAPTDWTGLNDFRGALHIQALGDAYILNNEIGAGLPYFDTYPDPQDMLRDPVNRRICALAAIGFMGTSVISGNLFENGDRGVAIIGGGLYCTFHNNRYELSGGTGLTIDVTQAQFFTFTNERFADNSLAGDGVYDDISIGIGAAGHVSFNAPIFESLAHPLIPTSTFKVRYHISNFGSTTISMTDPVVDPIYSTSGLVNDTDIQALPVLQIKLQYTPDDPIYNSISTERLITETQTGFVKLTRGTDTSSGNLTGGVQFYNADRDPVALIGFNASPDLTMQLNQTGGTFFNLNGDTYNGKVGNIQHTIASLAAGTTTILKLSGGNPEDRAFTVTLQPTGVTNIVGSGDTIIGGTGGGNINFKQNGTTFIPVSPSSGTTSSAFYLGRDTTTGEMVILDPSSVPSDNLQEVTAAGNTTSNVAVFTGTDLIPNTTGLLLALGTIWSGNVLAATYSPLNVVGSTINIAAQGGASCAISTTGSMGISGGTTTIVGTTAIDFSSENPVSFHNAASARIRVKVADATDADDAVTKAQLDAVTATIPTNALLQGGNAFASAVQVGSTDNNQITFLTNNTAVGNISTGGSFTIGNGLGTAVPTSSYIILNRKTDIAIAQNEHGFNDVTIFEKTSPTFAYASYDTRAIIQGTVNYDHYVSFQALPEYKSTGTITNLYGTYIAGAVTAGTVTNRYAHFVNDWTGAGGAVTNNYGIFINSLTKGTNNYSVYTGTAPSRFKGDLQLHNISTVAGTGYTIDWRSGSGEGTILAQATSDLVSTAAGHLRFKIRSAAGTPPTGMTEILTLLGGTTPFVGINTPAPATRLHVTGTAEQLRLAFDASNYLSTQIASAGQTTFTATGSSPSITFANNTNVNGLFQITRTTEQQRTRYDASNYLSTTVASNGGTTLTAVGTSPSLTLSNNTSVNGTHFVTSTTIPQARIGYDASNYYQIGVSSVGFVQFSAAGSSGGFAFNNRVNTGAGIATGPNNSDANFNVPNPDTPSNTTDADYLLPGGVGTAYRVGLSGSLPGTTPTNQSFCNLIVARTPFTTHTSGTHPVGSSLLILAPAITSGGATVTDAACLSTQGTVTGGTNNWAILATNAASKFSALNLAITTVTGNTTLDSTHHTVIVNNTGSITITLPAAASNSGRVYIIKKISAASNDVIIDGNASETIDGTTTKTLTLQYSSIKIQCDGSNWHIVSSYVAALTL